MSVLNEDNVPVRCAFFDCRRLRMSASRSVLSLLFMVLPLLFMVLSLVFVFVLVALVIVFCVCLVVNVKISILCFWRPGSY